MRKMAEISMEERKEILLELETEDSAVVRERHDINNTVVSHLRYFYGRKKPAKRRGQRTIYHKDLIGELTSPVKDEITRLKQEGKNSLEASQLTGIPLPRMNAIWGTISIEKVL